VRFDYQYQADVVRTTGPGTTGYSPDLYGASLFHYGNAGAGVKFDSQTEMMFTVKNVIDSQTPTLLVGRVIGNSHRSCVVWPDFQAARVCHQRDGPVRPGQRTIFAWFLSEAAAGGTQYARL
jgi:hypothetical protein